MTQQNTLPETNIAVAPEKGWLEDDPFLLGWPIFRGHVGFGEDKCSNKKMHYDWAKKFHPSPPTSFLIFLILGCYHIWRSTSFPIFTNQIYLVPSFWFPKLEQTSSVDSSPQREDYQDVSDSKQEPHAIAYLSSFVFLSLILNQFSPNPYQSYVSENTWHFLQLFRGQEKRFLDSCSKNKQLIRDWGVSTKSYTKTSNYTRVESKWPNYQWRVQLGHGSQTLSSFQLLQSFLTFTKSLPLPHHNGLEESGHSSGRASLVFSLGSL